MKSTTPYVELLDHAIGGAYAELRWRRLGDGAWYVQRTYLDSIAPLFDGRSTRHEFRVCPVGRLETRDPLGELAPARVVWLSTADTAAVRRAQQRFGEPGLVLQGGNGATLFWRLTEGLPAHQHGFLQQAVARAVGKPRLVGVAPTSATIAAGTWQRIGGRPHLVEVTAYEPNRVVDPQWMVEAAGERVALRTLPAPAEQLPVEPPLPFRRVPEELRHERVLRRARTVTLSL